jgi:hypothetical protein
VDSTFYSTVSMLRTMEVIVGIGPLSQFAAAATPMLNPFSQRPKLDPVDSQVFNEAIWKSVRGANSEMPAPVTHLRTREEEDTSG